MKLAITAVLLVIAAAAPQAVRAALELAPKAALAAASSIAPPHTAAPFSSPSPQLSEVDFSPVPEVRHMSNSSCGMDREICYDMESGRIVFKPARALMPQIRGLTADNISVKRDRIIFRYTF